MFRGRRDLRRDRRGPDPIRRALRDHLAPSRTTAGAARAHCARIVAAPRVRGCSRAGGGDSWVDTHGRPRMDARSGGGACGRPDDALDGGAIARGGPAATAAVGLCPLRSRATGRAGTPRRPVRGARRIAAVRPDGERWSSGARTLIGRLHDAPDKKASDAAGLAGRDPPASYPAGSLLVRPYRAGRSCLRLLRCHDHDQRSDRRARTHDRIELERDQVGCGCGHGQAAHVGRRANEDEAGASGQHVRDVRLAGAQ